VLILHVIEHRLFRILANVFLPAVGALVRYVWQNRTRILASFYCISVFETEHRSVFLFSPEVEQHQFYFWRYYLAITHSRLISLSVVVPHQFLVPDER
jgi:hypothetical protein